MLPARLCSASPGSASPDSDVDIWDLDPSHLAPDFLVLYSSLWLPENAGLSPESAGTDSCICPRLHPERARLLQSFEQRREGGTLVSFYFLVPTALWLLCEE